MPGSWMGLFFGANCCPRAVLWVDLSQQLNTHSNSLAHYPSMVGQGREWEKQKWKNWCAKINSLISEEKTERGKKAMRNQTVTTSHKPTGAQAVSEQQLPWKLMHSRHTLKVLNVHWEMTEKCLSSGSFWFIMWHKPEVGASLLRCKDFSSPVLCVLWPLGLWNM